MRSPLISTLTKTALVLTLLSGTAFAHGDWQHSDKKQAFDQALATFPAADAAKFRDTMKKSHEQNKANIEKIHALHQEMHAILTADSFDKAAFLDKSNKLQSLMNKEHTARATAFANAVAGLTKDERTALAEAMHKGHGEHSEHHADKAPVQPAPAASDDQ